MVKGADFNMESLRAENFDEGLSHVRTGLGTIPLKKSSLNRANGSATAMKWNLLFFFFLFSLNRFQRCPQCHPKSPRVCALPTNH